MVVHATVVLSAVLLLAPGLPSAAPGRPQSPPRTLTRAEVAAGMAALERVRNRHRLGSEDHFERRFPLETWVERSREMARKTDCLASRFGVVVDDAALSRALHRVLSSTQDAAMLEEMLDALGRDPVLIKECLIRPLLVERLLVERVAWDPEIQAEPRWRARSLAAELGSDPFVVADQFSPRWSRVRYGLEPDPDPAVVQVEVGVLAELARESRASDGTAVRKEGSDAITLRVGRPCGVGCVDALVALVDKVDPGGWWEAHRGSYSAELPPAWHALPEAAPHVAGPGWARTGRDPDPIHGSWWVRDLPPEARTHHSTVWTGNEMIVWGGIADSHLGSGARYEPATDTWIATSRVGAPSPRARHTAVWTGSEMIVWGGFDWSGDPGGSCLDSGARYDPASDTWTPVSMDGTPFPRAKHTAVWTGSEMIVWGGATGPTAEDAVASGGRYDPSSDTWRPTSTQWVPHARYRHAAVWSGTEMIVWGGGYLDYSNWAPLNTGGRYRPDTDAWSHTSADGAPYCRVGSSSVWTGSELIVLGLWSDDEGARYAPATDTWAPITTMPELVSRQNHTAVWTGSRMIVWGGLDSWGPSAEGGSYDPLTDTWQPVALDGAPPGRSLHSAVWTGSEMIVWGGSGGGVEGGRYDPVTNTWARTSVAGAPAGLEDAEAVWTGAEWIVWGGLSGYQTATATGSAYEPATDTWVPLPTLGAPGARSVHTAVWTGTEMLVWGGYDHEVGLADGGAYDPVGGTWRALPFSPLVGRGAHTAVWTGNEMLVWGGYGGGTGGGLRGDGARYLPSLDLWVLMPAADAPAPRHSHTAVWSDEEMIVWGGWTQSGPVETGGRYSPFSNQWLPVTTSSAPLERSGHTAVWTGHEMVVWGGRFFFGGYDLDTGGVYDPASDSWVATSIEAPPSPRERHTAVWSGSEMIVCGGTSGLKDGGRYDPSLDLWTPTSLIGAPTGRNSHVAGWTGERMLVWGGWWGYATSLAAYSPCAVPEIQGPSRLCWGHSAALDAGSGYGSYLWSPGGWTTQTITVAPAQPTTYWVEVTAGAYGSSGTHHLVALPPRDVDGDGEATSGDLVALVRSLFGPSAECVDVRADGALDGADLSVWVALPWMDGSPD